MTAYSVLCFGLVVAIQLTIFDANLWAGYFEFARAVPQAADAQ